MLLSAFPAGTPLAAEDFTFLGGGMTSNLPGKAAVQVTAPNVTDSDRAQQQIDGFTPFHKKFTPAEGVGPLMVNASCGGCHVENAKGPLRLGRGGSRGSSMVVKVSLKGEGEGGAPIDVPGIGEQLQDRKANGRRNMRVRLRWREKRERRYRDGTTYSLRKPRVTFRIPGYRRSEIAHSLRMTPSLVGLGLLQAIPEETILALSDPEDSDGDGISGRPQYVPDKRNGGLALGRFGFKGSHPTVEQQSAAAAFFDMGLSNDLFYNEEEGKELSDYDLELLDIYQVLGGTPRAINQDKKRVQKGFELFKEIGCDSCHIPTLETGEVEGYPELSNHTIHPFTDMLLHDMGPGLADKRSEYSASGSEWRTTPLWGLGTTRSFSGVRPFYLHDGRARTLEEAILWHGGEAKKARQNFKRLRRGQRKALIAFLNSL